MWSFAVIPTYPNPEPFEEYSVPVVVPPAPRLSPAAPAAIAAGVEQFAPF
jgi:hypothetical protein